MHHKMSRSVRSDYCCCCLSVLSDTHLGALLLCSSIDERAWGLHPRVLEHDLSR